MPMTDLLDPLAGKIVLATRRGDSTERIAAKLGVSDAWVYDWVERLEAEGVLARDGTGLRVVDHELRDRYDQLVGALYRRGGVPLEHSYVLPHLAGPTFAFTEIDAAYIRTNGTYQLESHDGYPVSIAVHDRDLDRWLSFFEAYGVETTIDAPPDASDLEDGVCYVLFPESDGIEREWVDGYPVTRLDTAVERMMEQRPAYEPALEAIADEIRMKFDIEVQPREQ